MPISTSDLLRALGEKAKAEGLSAPFITAACLPDEVGVRLTRFVEKDFHGDMQWLKERIEQRQSPDALWPEARSAIVFAQNYGQHIDSLARLQQPDEGVISVYGLNRDYHDVLKGKLKRIASWLHQSTAEDVKVFVDTAPVMEKPLAQAAGLGWQGKHTNLVSRDEGSWFFIGTILTTALLPATEPEKDHCGSCHACLDICPTKAFPAPRQLDARRCISYLTIEHKSAIPMEFRKPMGNRIYGCDDCLAVCPWNKFAAVTREIKLTARDELIAPKLEALLLLDDAAFRKLFAGSPVKRIGRNRFLRNCLIAAGNSGNTALTEPVIKLLDDASELVRAMAVWALAQLMQPKAFKELSAQRMHHETDHGVITEWEQAA